MISTFAGCGGSSLGYSMAGFRELIATDFWELAGETFRFNFPKRVTYYVGDVCDLTGVELMKMAGISEGELDVLDGSPPCQGFSTAGKRQLDDPRNDLFRQFVRLLHDLQPRAFMMENVSGMVKGKMRIVYAEAMRALRAQGYDVRSWVMNAAYFGVPQKRQRVIFIGTREDLGIDHEPPPFDAPWPPYSFAEGIGSPSRILWSNPRDRGEFTPETRPSYALKAEGMSDANRREVIGVFSDGFRRGDAVKGDEPSPAVMEHGLGVSAAHQMVGAFSAGEREGTTADLDKPSEAVLAASLGRVFSGCFQLGASSARSGYKPAPALTGKALATAEKLATIPGNEYLEMRSLSVGEVMRLQSFPDQFDFGDASWKDSWRMVGNSVPPLMMRGIARQIRKLLEGTS